MLDKAIEKLKAEMEQNKGNEYVKTIGQFLINYLNAYPEQATEYMNSGKTVAQSLKEIETAAKQKPKVGNYVMMNQGESLNILYKTYCIKPVSVSEAIMLACNDSNGSLAGTIITTMAGASQKPSDDFDFKLEDLL